MENSTQKKLLTLDREIVSKGIKRAKSQKRKFSAYVELLIEQDLATQAK